MNSDNRAIVVLALLFVAGFQSVGTRAQSPPVLSATGRIEGTVVDALTGRPISGVQINVPGSSATSAADGRFTLSGIPAGTQNLTTLTDRYLPAPGDGRYLTLTPGQQLTGVVVRLTPSGIVTGRVSNSRGEPVVGAQIVGYRETYNKKGELQFQIAAGGSSSDRTDDRGQFRVFRYVQAGDYLFRVEPPQLPPGDPGETFAPLYFPGTSDIAKAGTYTVRAGEETDLKSVVLPPAQGGKLHVRVINQSGAENPTNQILLQIQRKGLSGLGVRYGPFPSVGPGRDVGKLPSGAYEVYAVLLLPGRGPENRSIAIGHASLEIVDSDVDLDLVIRKGVKLTGHIVTESTGGTTVPISGAQIRLSNPETYNGLVATSGADGAFTTASAPAGFYEVSNVTNVPQGFVVKSVEAGDSDLLIDGLRISDQDIDIRVILGPPAGAIRGTVRDANGVGTRGATVILLGPGDKRGFQAGSTCSLITTPTDQNGAFELTVARSGTYRVLAGMQLDRCAPLSAEFMKKNETRVVSVRVDAGARVEIDLNPLDP